MFPNILSLAPIDVAGIRKYPSMTSAVVGGRGPPSRTKEGRLRESDNDNGERGFKNRKGCGRHVRFVPKAKEGETVWQFGHEKLWP